MKIVYLASTRADIEWMRRYYSGIFPAGAKQAREHFRACEKNLIENPMIGHPSEIAGVRELVVARTPGGAAGGGAVGRTRGEVEG